jgi:biotin carboxylase
MSDDRRAILIVSAGVMQIPALERAKRLGYYVVATDRNPDAAGFALADERVVLDVKDVEGHVAWARANAQRVNLRGAFAAADVAVTVAHVAAALGLPGIPVEVAERSNNKALMKQRWLRDGVPTPYSEEVRTLSEAEHALERTGFPAIVKAVDSAASRGTQRIDRKSDLAAAFEAACAVSRTGTAIVEQFVVGREQSVETIVFEGRHHHVSLADRHFGFSPYAIETAHVDPSTTLDATTQAKIRAVVDSAARSLGIDWGPAKADMILSDRGPMILEMPARLSGGFHSQVTTPASTGRDPITAVLKLAMGESLDEGLLASRWEKTSVCAGIFPEPGVIRSIRGLEEARALPGVIELVLTKKVGDRVEPYIDNAKRCCWVIVVGENESDAWSRVEDVKRTLRFDMA